MGRGGHAAHGGDAGFCNNAHLVVAPSRAACRGIGGARAAAFSVCAGRARTRPTAHVIADQFLHLVFRQRSAVVGVQPSALQREGVLVNVRSDDLELAGAQRGQLSDQIDVAAGFLQQVTDLLDVLRLGEAADEGGVGLCEDLVVHVADVLRGQNAGHAVFSGLFEDEFDEVFRRRIAGMRRQVGRHFVHEEQELELPLGRLLGQHPVVELA